MAHNVWVADRFWFTIQGKNPQRFLNLAVSEKIHLAYLHWIPDGLMAQGLGPDYERLRDLAAKGGWSFSVQKRRGPGLFLERLLARPGILAGAVLFAVLLQGMGSFVWTIQFGELSGETQHQMRNLLVECGIYEGTVLDEQTLAMAQAQALQQSEVFGWVSLNFTDGCLSIESTDAQYQTIQEEPPLQPLYAKASGEIVAVEAESGFAAVVPKQQVEQGQLLVDVVRLDRDGNEIRQGASGRIMARCEKTYTVFQPYSATQKILDGGTVTQNILCFFGTMWQGEEPDVPEQCVVQTDWQPLRVGRLSLPGCVCSKTFWPQTEQTVSYTQKQAEALARRACRAELYNEFPDAEIESQMCEVEPEVEGVTCTISYRFFANIATVQS